MQIRSTGTTFYAKDLTGFLSCRHLTTLERLAARGVVRRPHFEDPMLEVLQERGLAHERAYVDHLAASGKRVVAIDKDDRAACEATREAMRGGADVIVQARLEHGSWAGWADVLLRVDGKSALGSYLYEPVETKLATETKAATLVQLCLYASLLAEMQGAAPEVLRVVVPESAFEPKCFRFDELGAYFRLVRRMFEAEIETPLPASLEAALPYPEPVGHCDVCNWWSVCQTRWEKDDHVSLVAGIHKTQRKELQTWGIATLAGLAVVPLPLERKPSRGSASAIVRVREQARVQLEARTSGKPVYELLPVEAPHGLTALPEPSPLDVFLDLEGDRLAEHGGFDYLFGYAFHDEDGRAQYEAVWAVSREEEKAAFERLIDFVVERRSRDAAMHVYHYAPYEPTAMKRLMGRYATRADELDRLLRERVFVDLYGVVRRGVRAGVDSYSIKRLEPFYGLAREVDLRQAARQRAATEYAIAKGNAASLSGEVLDAVRGYNRDDCLSALGLRDWLEGLRAEAARASGATLPRPVDPPNELTEEVTERQARIRALAEALVAGLPLARDRSQDAQWTLAQLLEWHRREDNASWWEYHRLNEMPVEDLLDEPDGLGGLRFVDHIAQVGKGSVVDRYRFPAQDTNVEEQDELYQPGTEKRSRVGVAVAIDFERQTVDLRKGPKWADTHPTALFKHDIVVNKEAVESLLRLGQAVLSRGIDGAGPHRAARDLLLRRNPRLLAGEVLRRTDEDALAAARRVGLRLDGGVLAVQGPPGAGKTYAGARMIVDLVRAGKSVGITAVSHKVIRNLLDEVVRAAAEEGVDVRCLQRVRERSSEPPIGIEEEDDAKRGVARILRREFDVVGGTAWVWAKEDLEGALDVLVVDEAGQMSLANVLACAQAATNLVLLGDPQQLEQPQKASHPDGAELSALEYLLEGRDTMPEDRGLFLDKTWRLHPSICTYTSEMFYEGKLKPHESLVAQSVSGPTPFAGAGLFYVPVEHDGNQNSAPEEAERIAAIVGGLTSGLVMWTDRRGQTRPLSRHDVLIVAPYNAQVSEIAERVSGARVGTVDKFQGQEAPVVIYSMTTSSPEEAPHGMEFLFSRHRMNVATSRARCVSILVGNPKLFEPECRTPDQMRMANAFCRYLELATVVE
jgi:predicted RecB family nuclease